MCIEDYRDKIITTAEPGEPIVLQCNLSEIYSNVLVSVDIPGKNRFEFRPLLSGMDGSIVLQSGSYDFVIESGWYDFTVREESLGFSRNYLFDMVGEWWSEPQKDKDGAPVYYRLQLERPDRDTNCFEFSVGDSVYNNWYGIYSLTDSEANEYSYTMYAQEKERSGKFVLTRDGNRLTVRESDGDRLFFLTEEANLGFSFHPHPDLSGYDSSVQFAYEMLRVKDEIQYHVSHSGMELIYTNKYQNINNENCMIFALGTNHDDQFVREFFYAVSENGDLYFYDVINDSWLVLGQG